MLSVLRRFGHHLRNQRRALAGVFGLGLCGAAVSLATPLLGKLFVDAVAERGDFGVVPKIAAALVALAVADLLLAAWSQRIHARMSAQVLADLRASLFERCVRGPLDAIEPFRHGDLMTRFGSDVPRIQALLVDGVLGAIHNVLFLAVAAAITFSLSPALALWSFFGVIAALCASAAFRRPIEARTHRVREAMAGLSHFLSERLSGLRAIRLHGSASGEIGQLRDASDRLGAEVVRFQMLNAMSTGVPALALTLALAWVYLAGGRLLESGAISLGTFVAFVLYQARLFGPAQGLLGLVRGVQEARVSVARIVEMLGAGDASPASRARAAAAAPSDVIVLDGVSFAYAQKPPVLRGASLRVRTGERVALFGPSGAGKSTLVQLVFGLRTPLAGSVFVAGRPAHERGTYEAREVLGYAGAEPFLLHASVEENVRYGNQRCTRQALEHALALAEATSFVQALPDGLRTIVGGRGLALSDGQRQRLGLARLFLGDTRILVLDEAFCALDAPTESRIRDRLWAAYPDRTVLFISHRISGLHEFDRLMLLRDGGLVELTAGELVAAQAACA